MSLYAEYKLEREGKKTIESPDGFLTYSLHPDVMYIEDLFVTKDKRSEGHAVKLANEALAIAKGAGCKKVLGSIVPLASGSTESMRVLIDYGFKIQSSQENFIWLEMEI